MLHRHTVREYTAMINSDYDIPERASWGKQLKDVETPMVREEENAIPTRGSRMNKGTPFIPQLVEGIVSSAFIYPPYDHTPCQVSPAPPAGFLHVVNHQCISSELILKANNNYNIGLNIASAS